ncbi:MAG: hypothetical protein QXQ94_06200 [Candidatus Bathyarchaeia archaeon]
MSASILELWTNEIPTRIFNQIILTREIIKLIIVSPWITPQRDEPLLEILCRRIRREKINTLVITRTPTAAWHKKAVSMLEKAGARIYYNDNLHAKIILVKSVNFEYGFFGTANLTYNANFTDDAVIFIKGKGEGKNILERLTLYAYHLK